MMRSTAQIVSTYSAEETYEEELETSRRSYINESSDAEDESRRLVSTPID